ncbi:DoxX family protein [Rhodoferax sp.]|uniref:DoxX family protein n=1 Tax=Rhodoferax sp. TaxID=50421 RepID=UPI00261828F2|nr:DoxX family protein [Rhodoferax sp.]MDD2926017.1 DoxX family protein [Rhodoferax sp.]
MSTHTEPIHQPGTQSPLTRLIPRFVAICRRFPPSALALLARFSIAAVFWKSGQTKIQGLAIDIVNGHFILGWPQLSDSVVPLFKDEYRLPLVAPEIAASMAAVAEHFFPLLILLGFATRLSALALLGMTMTIQLLVYPDAYPTHGTWAAVLLYLVTYGPGKLSLDHWITQRHQGVRA